MACTIVNVATGTGNNPDYVIYILYGGLALSAILLGYIGYTEYIAKPQYKTQSKKVK